METPMPTAPAIPDTPNPISPVQVTRGASSLEIAPAAWQIAHRLCNTDFVPRALKGNPEAVLACIMSGHELGIGPMQALQKIYVIEGRPSIAAELMRALVAAQGHEVWFEDMNTERVTIVGRRRDQTRETRVTWTMDDARRAKLADKDNWKKYPLPMLQARATAVLCRAMFADVLAGFSYTTEELTDGVVVDDADLLYRGGEPSAAAPPGGLSIAASGGKRTRERAVKAAAPAAAPAPTPPLPGEDDAPQAPTAIDPDDEVADGEIVDDTPDGAPLTFEAGDTMAAGPDPFPPDPEPPVDNVAQHRMTPAGALAARYAELGITDRETRLLSAGGILGRDVASFNDLSIDEIKRCFDTLLDDDSTIADPVGAPDAVAGGTDDAGATPAPVPEAKAEEDPRPSAPTERRGPDAGTMTGDQWRDVLKRRGVKAAELLAKARELAGTGVGTLDDIASTGVGQDLLDYVEDLALSRGK